MVFLDPGAPTPADRRPGELTVLSEATVSSTTTPSTHHAEGQTLDETHLER